MVLSEILKIKESQIITSKEIILKLKSEKKEKEPLPLGSRNFDDAIGGGFFPRKKYLIFGANKTGKTQLCHQLCIQAYRYFNDLIRKNNRSYVFYFDTENTFRPERLKQLEGASVSKINNILKNIKVSKVMSNAALLLALKDFDKKLKSVGEGILIIDSINNHFRSDLGNEKITFNRVRNVFLDILYRINELTNTYNLITVATSQINPNFFKKGVMKELPVGNQYLNHFFSEYIYLRKKDRETNYVQLVNSLHFSEKKVLYKITSKGIQDYKL